MSMSLRVSMEVKKRIARLAEARATTPHAFMLEAIEEKVEAEEAQAAMLEEAKGRLEKMKKNRLGIPADEVFSYLKRRVSGKPAKRPTARRLP